MVKKFLYSLIMIVLLLEYSMVSYAGDVPESLLAYEEAQVYFGEVKSVGEESITVIQKQHIKGGRFTENSEITYPEFCFTENPCVGQVYLCGYLDENNPLYIWETSSQDTDELEITNQDDMSKRMEEYLNEGKFREAEAERLTQQEKRQKMNAEAEARREEIPETNNAEGQQDEPTAVFDAGRQDGPTAVFDAGGQDESTAVLTAGKTGTDWNWINVCGLIIYLVMVFFC